MPCNENGAPALTGVVFDIQRCSIHDGHGIRTLVFLKGCPLRCEWCANPESQNPAPQIGFFQEKCAGCMRCADVCPHGQVFRASGQVDWAHCLGCMKCVEACLYEARIPYGKRMTVDAVMDAVRRDKVFFEKTGGGVTVSGGEATAQPAFVRELFRRCRAEGIHTAMETTGFAPWESLRSILQYTDLLLYDFKNMDSAAHKAKTGVGNERILDNAVKASQVVGEMIARFPLIPDYNDGEGNARQMGAFIKDNMPSVKRVDILKYHSVGESKSGRIGKEYSFRYEHELSDEKVDRLKAILEGYGLQVSIGG
jgi:pyruvate formate lyase activating enzyme